MNKSEINAFMANTRELTVATVAEATALTFPNDGGDFWVRIEERGGAKFKTSTTGSGDGFSSLLRDDGGYLELDDNATIEALGATDSVEADAILEAATGLGSVGSDDSDYPVSVATLGPNTRLYGDASLFQQNVDQGILIFAEPDQSQYAYKCEISGLELGPMPTPTADDFSAVNFTNTFAGHALFNLIRDVGTGVRNSYRIEAGGVDSSDNLTLGNTIIDAETIGIENIHASYPRVIANSVSNGGVQVGIHGVRVSGRTQGAIVAANSLRDRAGPGVSVQQDAFNGVFSALYIENTTTGFEGTAVSTINGRHIFTGSMIKDTTNDAVDLDFLSDCLIQAYAQDAGGFGFDTGSNAAEGRHRIDGISRGGVAGGARIRSDKNLVTVVVSDSSAAPCLVTGDDNLIVVMAADETISNTVFVTGSRNVIIMVEAGTGAVGLRLDGSDCVVQGRVTGNAVVNGDNNLLYGHYAGTLTVTGDNNELHGKVAGAISNTGTGNQRTTMQAL